MKKILSVAAAAVVGVGLIGFGALNASASSPSGPVSIYTNMVGGSFNTVGTQGIYCNTGDFATGGGVDIFGSNTETIRSSLPVANGSGDSVGWYVVMDSSDGITHNYDARVICLHY
jgi:hypothetical protein